jgi:DNA (cytosine-5)-methyltransferase 1
VLGVEYDGQACDTRRAAGHPTLQADVSALDPPEYPAEGLIASPPCQGFSMAGKGGGRRDTEHVLACLAELAAGQDTRAEHAARCEDARSMLLVEPLRWALATRPAWIALEQVPPVLPLWRAIGGHLEAHGYRWWTGVLEAERFGVPQTRERAILLAARDGRAPYPPEPTHQRYVKGEPPAPADGLFGGLLPWVSMAEALGWTDGATVNTRGNRRTSGGNEFSADGLSWALTEKTRSWRMRHNYGFGPVGGGGAGRLAAEPAATLQGSNTTAQAVWATDQAPCKLADAARVTVREAALLQTFPADYPWQGSRTAQFQQIGNAVPPLLAWHVLRAITGRA